MLSDSRRNRTVVLHTDETSQMLRLKSLCNFCGIIDGHETNLIMSLTHPQEAQGREMDMAEVWLCHRAEGPCLVTVIVH